MQLAAELKFEADEIIDFWLANEGKWFAKDAAFDKIISAKYQDLYTYMVANNDWRLLATQPNNVLALILLFDQFPRNMFRDTPKMYATDAKALELTLLAIEQEFDLRLQFKNMQMFLYMPLMHSEDLKYQNLCVKLFQGLDDAANALKFAIMHRDIIANFGRFPHRNKILGRQSTADELEFLQKPGSSF